MKMDQTALRQNRVPWSVLLAVAVCFACAAVLAAEEAPWPSPVPGWKAPQPGEHPRLLFRRGDLPKLRQRARTPSREAPVPSP